MTMAVAVSGWMGTGWTGSGAEQWLSAGLPVTVERQMNEAPTPKSGDTGTEADAAEAEPEAGLTSEEAAARLKRDGLNVLPVRKSEPVWLQLFRQLVHFFALMLWVAAILAAVAGMPQLAVAIAVVIVINGVFAFVQEHRAQRAAERLNELLPKRSMVIRDGERLDVAATDLVGGDRVVLRPGDLLSADLVIDQADALRVDTSMLTGESEPADSGSGDTLFAGCFIVSGEGQATVVATGAGTRLASIAALTQHARRPRSPLEHELSRVVRAIAIIAVAIGVCFFGVSILVGGSPRSGFLFAVGVTVALVPEGLLPTVTLSLAAGAQEMARRNALVRHLESVETLGSTTFICTDKTGTITKNQMSVVEVWTPTGSGRFTGVGYDPQGATSFDDGARVAVTELARVAMLCSDDIAVQRNGHWEPEGDPLEAALYALAARCGVDLDRRGTAARQREFPFDATRRMMSIVLDGVVMVKGAPESVLACSRSVEGTGPALDALTKRGLRVIAVATRTLGMVLDGVTASDVERDLDLLGLVAVEDPPRDGVREALASTRKAGIRVAMLTGDNADTAAAIAREVGLLGDDGAVLSGPDLPEDVGLLGALVDRDGGVVISRVTPEDKLDIAHALQHRGHVVAMTGDGVNDGPALQAADIGVAMGESGTDVARAASDLVLLDDDFTTIVTAVQLGRVTFTNMRRFLTYHLVCNVAEVTPFILWAISGGRFPLMLGVLQILCFDLGVDVVPALALGVERMGARSLDQTLQGRHLIDGKVLTRVFGVLGPAEAVMEVLAFFVALLAVGWAPGHPMPTGHALAMASGTAFATVIFCQIGTAFACRSATAWPGRLGWFSNRLLLIGVGLAIALLMVLEFVPPVASVLGQAPPPAAGWAVAVSGVAAMLGVDAAHKSIRNRRHRADARRSSGSQAAGARFRALPPFDAPGGQPIG